MLQVLKSILLKFNVHVHLGARGPTVYAWYSNPGLFDLTQFLQKSGNQQSFFVKDVWFDGRSDVRTARRSVSDP
jgi:hypothetical protein